MFHCIQGPRRFINRGGTLRSKSECQTHNRLILTAKEERGMPTKKRKPNPAFMKPVQPDAALGAVVGTKAISRPQVTKKIWEYIKKNGLQDKKKKTMINADDKLKVIFGGKKQVTMFEMTKLVSQHVK